MRTDPANTGGDREALLAEVRRRAGRRRLRRRVGVTAVTAVAVAGLVVGVSTALGAHHTTTVHVLGHGSGPPTTTTTPVNPTTATIATTAPPGRLFAEYVPVTMCPTEVGIPLHPSPSLGVTRLVVPDEWAHDVSIYAATYGRIEIVAPSGWACRAVEGADGSASIIASPNAQSIPVSGPEAWKLGPGDTTQAVAAQETSACVGCTEGQACPLFPAAAQAMQANLGHGCPSRPATEQVEVISAGLDGFQDPPGVAGTATPSGGAFPADGAMTYYPTEPPDGSWTETCTLPPADHDFCSASLNQFIALYGGR